MTLKSKIRRYLPSGVVNGIGGYLVRRRERQLAQLPLPQAFDAVYKQSMWKQGTSLSGVGSEGLLADRYVALVRSYAAEHQLSSVLDGGCGDFAVGSRLAPLFQRYMAVDVSKHIIEINKRRYQGADWQHVTFTTGDLTSMSFPSADLVLIRQVLQHLTNAHIETILKNLENGIWRRALITESVHDPLSDATANLDLASHSVRTRASYGSGVFIDRPPFSRMARRLATIYASMDGSAHAGGLLVVELSRDAR